MRYLLWNQLIPARVEDEAVPMLRVVKLSNVTANVQELHLKYKGKGKGTCLESRLHGNACSTDFTSPLARWAPTQPVTIDPTLDMCTRYPLRLGGLRQCGIRSLPDTSTHGQYWELTF